MCFHLRDEEMFAFAGLYDVWTDPRDGQEGHRYTILTTAPNELLASVHNRMPVILKRDDEERWLSPDETEPDRFLSLLVPYPAGDMEGYAVSRLVNSSAHDVPELIDATNGP
jgi:putative SOS response-associated peptidase YedK